LQWILIPPYYGDGTKEVTARLDANLREMKAVIRTNQERTETKIEVNNEKFVAFLGTLLSQIDIQQARIEAKMEAPCQEHQEVPKEEAAVKTIRALEGQYLAVRHCQRNRQRAMVGPGRSWPPPANG
jgi:hypothetical protein